MNNDITISKDGYYMVIGNKNIDQGDEVIYKKMYFKDGLINYLNQVN